ncbi:polymorphic toxin-type HINT domain-containing protein [Tautonia rosea]|uniref:polymorphic toxin-type HINT domain-containing protein n=1 Tax=Tautonia rosea TaxID=2728037 RepID=UPI001472A2DB|nr:polymorphic toxin-type HINT domain-containing protein [Tautonia rosea]
MCCPSTIGPVWIVSLGLSLATGVPDTPDPAPEESAYRAAAEAAGRDADAQLQLALWCEAQGRLGEARHHLALAVLIDPNHAAARALMGRVRLGESWVRPGDVPRRFAPDPEQAALREEYEGRRSRLEPTADAHWKLALWCEQKGLRDEATAHFTAVTRLNPKREAAWKRLGYAQKHGRWMTPDQFAVTEAEAAARAAVEAEWRPRLEQWAAMLADPARRGEAITALGAVDHPLLVPAVWSVLVAGPRADQPAAVQVLGQIDAREASRALAFLAVWSDNAEVRRLATETLKRRDAREWADALIAMIRKPIQYSVVPVGGPGSPGELYVAGERYNYRRLYAAPPPPMLPMMPGDQFVVGPDGLPVVQRSWITQESFWGSFLDNQPAQLNPDQRRQLIDRISAAGVDERSANLVIDGFQQGLPRTIDRTRGERGPNLVTRFTGIRTLEIPVGQILLESQRAAAIVDEHLRRDVAAIEAHNAPIRFVNAMVLPVLKEATGLEYGEEPEAWKAWWVNQIGLRQVMPQNAGGGSTFTDVVTVQPRPVPVGIFDQTLLREQFIHSCFGRGTPVHTDRGPRPIEDLQVGDLVLSQDTTTGALSYRPIVATHHNPPSKTFEVRLEGETIVSSEFHRFWIAGRGWVMARDLKVGDVVRALGRTARVEAITDGQVQPVFNLSVADSRSFFVGDLGALVHDNSLPSTTLEPFDAVPDLAELTSLKAPEADSGG